MKKTIGLLAMHETYLWFTGIYSIFQDIVKYA